MTYDEELQEARGQGDEQPLSQQEKRNREAWLSDAITRLRRRFEICSVPLALPNEIAVSCGFPSHGGTRLGSTAVGEFWPAWASRRGIPEIYVSPIVDNPVEILAILVHELAHASIPHDGHGKQFRRAALALGLCGPMRATSPTPRLERELQQIAAALGPYPHGRLRLTRVGSYFPLSPTVPTQPTFNCPYSDKAQRNRYFKVKCVACDWYGLYTRKSLKQAFPLCCNHTCSRFARFMELPGDLLPELPGHLVKRYLVDRGVTVPSDEQ